ncbi:MAG: transcription termination/antitermination protein NusA [Armatimonadetes bacterium]|nr:transcription termination/antitermination protein NusA [Armatimonadota bacterium]NIM23746.1 transcription termination/antitermination protein NusA [Armatimonadota bacterium]NIM67623.1 transcription termination/antitermination protein NusA [Armatimonadota bacterium]NIM76142.1 transcription termination/antitermination protein NusA [Armatimonadota bacterium]NIN06825.1 transcription termination/antitermination protein NusA [Armatimonadota bacterium]
MQIDIVQALRDIEKEKDIPFDQLREITEAALVSAYRRHYGASGEIHVEIDVEYHRAAVYARKLVVEKVENAHSEMSLEEARKLDAAVEPGESMDIEVTPEDFGRIAAQTAKQVMLQRIREAEREILFEEFSARAGEVLTGTVQRREGRTVFVNLGKTEGVLPVSEQMHLDAYRPGERLKLFVLEVKRTTRTPRILLSRSHPGLLRRLFELEVPEISDGVVEIKAIAREAGIRSKTAVSSNQENVDPVGACVGHRGNRVQAVVDELRGEKIDIVRWHEEPGRFVAESLKPARVSYVILDEANHAATAVVADSQLSLAIGKEGQNVRLAVRLTGWKIDIRSDAQMQQPEGVAAAEVGEQTEGEAGEEAAVATEATEEAASEVTSSAEAVPASETLEEVEMETTASEEKLAPAASAEEEEQVASDAMASPQSIEEKSDIDEAGSPVESAGKQEGE